MSTLIEVNIRDKDNVKMSLTVSHNTLMFLIRHLLWTWIMGKSITIKWEHLEYKHVD